MEDCLNLRDQNLDSSKCTFYSKNVICRLSRSISSHFGAIHLLLKCVSQPEIAKKITKKTPILGAQGHSRSLMFALGLLKSMFNAENLICRLSWYISSHFVANQW